MIEKGNIKREGIHQNWPFIKDGNYTSLKDFFYNNLNNPRKIATC